MESATKGTVRDLQLPKANQNMANCLAFMESTTVHYANLSTLTVFGFMLLIPCTAKYVFKLWAKNVFSKAQLKELSKKIDE